MAPRKARFPGGGLPLLPAGVDPARGMFGTKKKSDDEGESRTTSKKAKIEKEKWPTQGGVASALGLLASSSTSSPSLASSSLAPSLIGPSASGSNTASSFFGVWCILGFVFGWPA